MGKHGGERCAQLNSPRCLSIRIWHCYILDNPAFSRGLPPVCREARSTAMPPPQPPILLPRYLPCTHRSTTSVHQFHLPSCSHAKPHPKSRRERWARQKVFKDAVPTTEHRGLVEQSSCQQWMVCGQVEPGGQGMQENKKIFKWRGFSSVFFFFRGIHFVKVTN